MKSVLPSRPRAQGSGRFGPALALALAATPLAPAVSRADSAAGPAAPVIRRGALEVVTTIQLDPTILAAVGLQIHSVDPSAATPEPPAASFVSIDAPSFSGVSPGS